MEAAEKIPKKLYVYLDTTRGLHHRHGVKDVRRRGAGHRVRHAHKRRVRRYPDAAVKKERCRGISPFLQQHQDNAVHDACERAEHDDRPRDDEHL